MRVQLLIRDKEYRDALTEMIAGTDIDVFVEIESDSSKDGSSVILTDIRPDELDENVLKKIAARTLFLSSVKKSETMVTSNNCTDNNLHDIAIHRIFKYSCINDIIAELALVHHEWTGYTGAVSPASRTFAVISETDHFSAQRCRILARQIVYRRGGSVLILPLGFVNDYYFDTSNPGGWFARLMYLIDEGRDYPSETFVMKDSYGVSYLMLPGGLNPVAGLSEDYLNKLILSVGCKFDYLILDMGSSLRKENIKIAGSADHVLYFGSGRRIPDISRVLTSVKSSRLSTIDLTPDEDESVKIDDFVLKISEV